MKTPLTHCQLELPEIPIPDDLKRQNEEICMKYPKSFRFFRTECPRSGAHTANHKSAKCAKITNQKIYIFTSCVCNMMHIFQYTCCSFVTQRTVTEIYIKYNSENWFRYVSWHSNFFLIINLNRECFFLQLVWCENCEIKKTVNADYYLLF